MISNQGGGIYGRGIWRYSGTTWSQLPGAAIRIAGSWDTGTYAGGIAPGGFWVINGIESIYYYNPSSGFQQIPGAAVDLAPTTIGGLFVLGVPGGSYGNPIYYFNLSSGAWTQQPGAGVSIATNTSHVYVVGADSGIYSAPVVAQPPQPTPRPTITPTGTPLNGPTYGQAGRGWGPTALANALAFPVQSRFDGAGLTVAIVIDSDVNPSDISGYLSWFQTPQTTRSLARRPVDGGAGLTDGQFEATLDLETVAGLAPGANVLLYTIPSLDSQSITDAYNTIISDGQASIVTSSFGGCEQPGASWENAESSVFQTGANDGFAFLASSGDQGSECFVNVDTYQYGVNYPASDPNVIGVGGTETWQPDGYTLTSSTAWDDFHASSGRIATGGGVSAAFSLPSYQQGLAGLASPRYRNVPDVAMPATWDAIYVNGSWNQVAEGTSWSSPEFAAMLAEIYEYCSARFISPTVLPYYVNSTAGANAFIDVVSGNNDYGQGTPYFYAQPGYDNTTGLGVPLGMPFAQTICPNRNPVARLRKPLTAPTLTHRPAVPFAADVVPKVRGLTDRGPRAADRTTRIQIVLRRTTDVASDERAVIDVLQSSGFTIGQTFRNHLVVDAEGPSSSVERLFGTRIHDVDQGRYGQRYTPVAPAVVPASLAPYVAGIVLDDLVTMTTGPRSRR